MNIDIINTFLAEVFPGTPISDFLTQLSNGQYAFWIERPLDEKEREVLLGRRIRNRRR